MVMLTVVGRAVTGVNVQLPSAGRPEQASVTAVGMVALADSASDTVPVWPPTMLSEVGVDALLSTV
jgi:hypothetical protein